MKISKNALLLVGGILIVASSLYTLNHLTDRTIRLILVPGVVVGLVSIGIATRLDGDSSGRHHP